MSHATAASSLAAKVKAQNRADKAAIEFFPILASIFTPFIGKKVVIADGSLIAKIKEQIPESADPSIHIYRDPASHYSIRWVIKTHESDGPHTVTYAEASIYVGSIANGILTKLYAAEPLRTDFTAEEIQQKRDAYQVAKEAATAAHTALGLFGEYDR